ncbi:MAG: DNA-directed RNA polymerase subunit H [Nitrososphaerota archaeon]|nr:DNA-directed RNA polymerase subunit H [Candidatus Bathyarchaeota archaeon]MDW8061081.1 DNA-directed RNA polymerase subunit H [Nitrososphaerota archaeon]
MKNRSRLKFNILDHFLVPRHELLSYVDAENILEKYGVEPHQLPLIRSSDPAVIAVGGKPGDIIRIRRRSPTAGIAIAYRYVTEG